MILGMGRLPGPRMAMASWLISNPVNTKKEKLKLYMKLITILNMCKNV